MKSPASQPPRAEPNEFAGFPSADELAALRAWYEGLGSREAVARYLGDKRHAGASSRGVLSGIRKRLASFARSRHQNDLAVLFVHRSHDRAQQARSVLQAIEVLRTVPAPSPLAGDDIERWFTPRTVKALRAHGIKALADLSVRMVRRRRWWAAIAGLGATSARQIESFFSSHPHLTKRAAERAAVSSQQNMLPWESLVVPHDVDGSQGAFRAPRKTCLVDDNYRGRLTTTMLAG